MKMKRIQRGWMKRMGWRVGTFLLLTVIFLCSSIPALASSGPTTAKQLKPFASRISGQHSLARTATCSGNGCNGLDPYQTGCAASFYPAASYEEATVDGKILVELEYSTICATNWTQAYWVDKIPGELVVDIERLPGPDGGNLETDYWGSANAWWDNSNQYYAPHNKAIACADDPNNEWGHTICTKAT